MNEEDKKKLDELTEKYTDKLLAEKDEVKEKKLELIAKARAEQIVNPKNKYIENYKNNSKEILNALKKIWGYICVLDKAATKELNWGKK